MPDNEIEEANEALASGHMSRRRFVGRLVAGGVTVTAAMAFADSALAARPVVAGAKASSTSLYGDDGIYGGDGVYGNPGGLPGTPPGKGGTPPGQGGTPPPFSEPTPGQGGTPPGKGGTPPGQSRPRRR